MVAVPILPSSVPYGTVSLLPSCDQPAQHVPGTTRFASAPSGSATTTPLPPRSYAIWPLARAVFATVGVTRTNIASMPVTTAMGGEDTLDMADWVGRCMGTSFTASPQTGHVR